jgi:hypothetical protein
MAGERVLEALGQVSTDVGAVAESLPRIDHHRQLFQSVALSSDDEQRRTLIKGYRDAGHDRWIVHAIGRRSWRTDARSPCRGPRRGVSDRS